MTAGSSMQAMIFTGPWHCSHSLMSMRNTRFRRRAQVITMDGMYVGFAGAKTDHGGMLFHWGAVIGYQPNFRNSPLDLAIFSIFPWVSC